MTLEIAQSPKEQIGTASYGQSISFHARQSGINAFTSQVRRVAPKRTGRQNRRHEHCSSYRRSPKQMDDMAELDEKYSGVPHYLLLMIMNFPVAEVSY